MPHRGNAQKRWLLVNRRNPDFCKVSAFQEFFQGVTRDPESGYSTTEDKRGTHGQYQQLITWKKHPAKGESPCQRIQQSKICK
ncbi:hypothetical protein R1flu_026647 [Riccia fluitans]|uniref:Uncharacterized protein n=1 Tax=Riccia fluitans TaxID=41844 RepID=A0ABD1XGI3_9MARC